MKKLLLMALLASGTVLSMQMPQQSKQVSSLCPPASLVKLITLTLALEEKIIEPDTVWDCKGYCYLRQASL